MNVKERVKELRAEQRSIEEKYNGYHALFIGVSNTVWPDPSRDKARARYKEINAEISDLISKGIADLRLEQKALEEQYHKFGKKLIYVFKGVPKDVSVAKKRYDEIDSEIRYLESLS